MAYNNVPKNLSNLAILTRGGRPDYSKLSTDPFPTPTLDEKGAILENSDTGTRFRWTGSIWIVIGITGSDLVIGSDFYLEVGKGNIPGHTTAAAVMNNRASSNTALTDVWGGGDNYSYPVAAESWEIVSDSPDDTNGGTGAWTVVVAALDINKDILTTQVVTLNGTNPVSIPGGAIYYRVYNLANTTSLLVLTAGSAKANVGIITLRSVGAEITRATIQPDDGTDNAPGKCEDGILTVPNGYTAFGLQVIINLPINESGEATFAVFPDGADRARILTGTFYLYENFLLLVFQPKFRNIEKTDFSPRVRTLNPNAKVTVVEEFIVIDNDYIDIDMLQSFSM